MKILGESEVGHLRTVVVDGDVVQFKVAEDEAGWVKAEILKAETLKFRERPKLGVSHGGVLPWLRATLASEPPSQYSMTKKKVPSSEPLSRKRTMCGC